MPMAQVRWIPFWMWTPCYERMCYLYHFTSINYSFSFSNWAVEVIGHANGAKDFEMISLELNQLQKPGISTGVWRPEISTACGWYSLICIHAHPNTHGEDMIIWWERNRSVEMNTQPTERGNGRQENRGGRGSREEGRDISILIRARGICLDCQVFFLLFFTPSLLIKHTLPTSIHPLLPSSLHLSNHTWASVAPSIFLFSLYSLPRLLSKSSLLPWYGI